MEKIEKELNDQIRIDEKTFHLGRFAIVISDCQEFISRVKKSAVENGCKTTYNGMVKYYDEDSHSGSFDGAETIFRKRRIYEWQKEYRFAFNTNNLDGKSKLLKIGSLNDIGFKLTLGELKNNLKININ